MHHLCFTLPAATLQQAMLLWSMLAVAKALLLQLRLHLHQL